MKIIAISDAHGQLPEIKDKADFMLIAGDMEPVWNHDVKYQAEWLDTKFRKWLNSLNVNQIISVCGNHSWIFQDAPELIPQDLPWIYLQDNFTIIDGFKIYGSPWQPTFMDWAFNLSEKELTEKFKLIPDDTDILISHGPPHGYGDRNTYKKHVGSKALLNRVDELKQLRLVVIGHIHEDYGSYRYKNIDIINCSLLNEKYQLVNDPIILEL